MSCEPDLLGLEEQPLHVALQAIPAQVRLRRQGCTRARGACAGTLGAAGCTACSRVRLSCAPLH